MVKTDSCLERNSTKWTLKTERIAMKFRQTGYLLAAIAVSGFFTTMSQAQEQEDCIDGDRWSLLTARFAVKSFKKEHMR